MQFYHQSITCRRDWIVLPCDGLIASWVISPGNSGWPGVFLVSGIEASQGDVEGDLGNSNHVPALWSPYVTDVRGHSLSQDSNHQTHITHLESTVNGLTGKLISLLRVCLTQFCLSRQLAFSSETSYFFFKLAQLENRKMQQLCVKFLWHLYNTKLCTSQVLFWNVINWLMHTFIFSYYLF